MYALQIMFEINAYQDSEPSDWSVDNDKIKKFPGNSKNFRNLKKLF